MAAPLLLIAALALPDCIHVSTAAARLRYKPDLDSVRDCQEKARRKLIGDAQAKGKPLTYAQIEGIDDRQRAEVREFLADSGTLIEGSTKNDRPLGGAVDEDLAKLSPEEGAEIRALAKRQGFVSPGMRDLIDAVVRDGGELTPETMKKLQKAGRAAKGAGLDLNIDQGTGKALLERDFDADKERTPEPPADPGNL